MSDDKVLKKLGKRIADLRLNKGLTQTELAYMCDFERPNLARIEAGNTNPTYLTLLKKIINTIGQVVYSEQLQGKDLLKTISVQSLPKGVYQLAIITDDGQVSSQSFVKE
jgi:transcriptional regulator with XRE-family HTH domain